MAVTAWLLWSTVRSPEGQRRGLQPFARGRESGDLLGEWPNRTVCICIWLKHHGWNTTRSGKRFPDFVIAR